VSRRQSDAPELLIVQFQGVASLLDLPVGHTPALRDVRKEYLDVAPSQVPAPASRMPRKNLRTHAMQYGMVFSCDPASRSTATYPPGQRGCWFSGATPRRVV